MTCMYMYVQCNMYLNWSWFQGKDLVSGSFGVAIHVEQDVDAIRIDAVGRLYVVRYL